jgi:selenocysteine lyase/cysteine desulfurase
MRRRTFLSGLGAAAGGLLVGGRAAGAADLDTIRQVRETFGPEDERFWRMIRAQFQLPADFAYLNTGGLGASPLPVSNRVKAMMDREEENPSPGHSEEDWARIRTKCATLLGPACDASEIALVSTATEGINVILNGLPLRRDDEVITSTHEHVALAIPLLHRMKTIGIEVKTFEPDLQSAAGNVDRIRALLTDRTRLIFVSHVTCTTGQVLPVGEIGRLAASRDIWFALDGAQSLGQFPIDIRHTGADFYTASAHKWLLGPKRTGLLYVRKDRLALLTPTIVGAYSDKSNSLAARQLELQPTAQRFEYGTQNDALIYGLESALDFVDAIGLPAIQRHNQALAEAARAGIASIPGVDLVNPGGTSPRLNLVPAESAARSAMLTFRLAGRDNREVASALVRRRLRVRSVTEAGLDGVRASFHVCNSLDEVDRLVNAVKELGRTRP